MDFVHSDTLNEYGKMVADKFLDKCRANGSYKMVYEDYEEGTCVLQDAVENLFDVCAWLYLTYDRYAFDTLNEWKSMDNGCAWKIRSKENTDKVIELSYEEVENELYKMFDKR